MENTLKTENDVNASSKSEIVVKSDTTVRKAKSILFCIVQQVLNMISK